MSSVTLDKLSWISTASVDYIRSAVQKRWGSDHVLITTDGLEIEDHSGTQGIYPYTYCTGLRITDIVGFIIRCN